jgi:hypothetical protein
MGHYDTIFHEDKTITYWSVYLQSWVNKAHDVPDQELAALGESDRQRVANLRIDLDNY